MALPAKNLLIDSFPPAKKEALLRRLETVDLPAGTLLYEADTSPRYIHFMTSGIASVVTVLAEGAAIEVGIVGREGIAEKLQLLGPQMGMTRCFVQVSGSGMRMPFEQFKQVFLQDPAVHRGVLLLVQHEAAVLSQLVACNRYHAMEERLARWLLMVQDRTGEPDVRLTQEFLGELLGARRSTVNLAAGSLQRSGLIDYRRSYIRIVNRGGLEGVACECYSVIHNLLRDLYKELSPA